MSPAASFYPTERNFDRTETVSAKHDALLAFNTQDTAKTL